MEHQEMQEFAKKARERHLSYVAADEEKRHKAFKQMRKQLGKS